MKLRLFAPSKSFILGEYLALSDGRAFVVNTKPQFELEVNLRGTGLCRGIHAASPAGHLLQNNAQFSGNIDCVFKDPHEGAGGYGASSAQFATVYAALEAIQKEEVAFQLKDSVLDVWRTYIEICSKDTGRTPSGADVIGQVCGGICHVSINPFSAESFQWPFESAGFLLVSTGKKIKTHEHLKDLKSFDASDLNKSFDQAIQSFSKASLSDFCMSIKSYYKALKKLDFVHPNSEFLLQTFNQVPGVLASKGCGALGGDVLLLVFDKDNATSIISEIRKKNLKIVATHEDIAKGVDIQVLPTPSLTRRLQT